MKTVWNARKSGLLVMPTRAWRYLQSCGLSNAALGIGAGIISVAAFLWFGTMP
jgi:hypothetical protein